MSILIAVLALPAFVGMVGMTSQSAYADEARPQDWSQDGSNPQTDSGSAKEGTTTGTTSSGSDSSSTDTNGIIYKCGNAGGADALGWIVCPAMTLAGEGTEYVYNAFVEPRLRIEPKLFTGGDGGTQTAWGTFRDIANVVFVIVFLIVIISQLTGYGVDNYGIKKILPKLIVAAILINLSYVLCVILIDISNILGNSLQALFDSLGSTLDPTVTINDAFDATGTTPIDKYGIDSTAGSLAVIGIVGVIVGMTGAVWATPGILLSAVLGIVGVFISIIFIFFLLAAREAVVVVLVVLSPLAVVCYMLPNTKKVYEKWMNLFKAMLLLYPICGLLIGGGNYVSSLLLTVGLGDGLLTAVTAMLAGIAPIFFIPTLTKQAFAAMGTFGKQLTEFGAGIRGRAQSGLANSQAFRTAQDRADKFRTRKLMEADSKYAGKTGAYASARRFLRGGDRGIVAARDQYLADAAAKQHQKNMLGTGFDAALIAQQKKAEGDDVANYMTLLNHETRNGEEKNKLNSMFRDYMDSGNTSGAVAAARIAGRRKDTADDFLKENLIGKGATSSYKPEMLQSVAKEVSTGENSGIYRASNPLGFEFAARLNERYDKDTKTFGGVSTEFSEWAQDQNNIHNALNNYVTDSKELVGMKNSSLGDLADLMESPGRVADDDVARLRKLASDTIDSKDVTGVWDSTKAENLYRIAGRSAEYGQATRTQTGGGGPRQTGSPDLTIPHGNTPTNIGGAGGADSVSE